MKKDRNKVGRRGPAEPFRPIISHGVHIIIKVGGSLHLDQLTQRNPIDNIIGFQYQDLLLIRKGKFFNYPSQGCRVLERMKSFEGNKIGKNGLKGFHLPDDMYLC